MAIGHRHLQERSMSTTAKDFVNHWSWAASKGLMNVNTAGAQRSAATAVLQIEKNWESLDISNLDVESLLKRFRNLKAKEYTPDSLKEYERRFRKALASYLAYVRDPGNWKFGTQERGSRNGNGGNKTEKLRHGAERQSEYPSESTKPIPPPRPGFVEYPFPLREDRIIRLSLPVDLKSGEVKRLAAFLETLAVDREFGQG
jgi:hypothetical protein